MAVKGLYAQFLAAGGKPPQLMQGGTSGTGVKPYSSTAQITEAMKDARYKNDPAFRASVEQRLSVFRYLLNKFRPKKLCSSGRPDASGNLSLANQSRKGQLLVPIGTKQ